METMPRQMTQLTAKLNHLQYGEHAADQRLRQTAARNDLAPPSLERYAECTPIAARSPQRDVGGQEVAASSLSLLVPTAGPPAPPADQQRKSEPDDRVQELEAAIRLVDEYCQRYIRQLADELLGPDGGFVATPLLGSHSKAASGPMHSSIHAILSHPSHSPSAIPSIQPLRGSPKHLVNAQVQPQGQQQARRVSIVSTSAVEPPPGGKRTARPSERKIGSTVSLVKLEEREDESLEEGDQIKEESAGEEEDEESEGEDDFVPSEEDEEYSPRKRKAGDSARKRGANVMASMFSSGTSKSGRNLKRKPARSDQEDESDLEEDDGEESASDDDGASVSANKKRKSKNGAAVSVPKQRRSKLPLNAVTILRLFFVEHIDKPFPTDQQKRDLAAKCSLNCKQISDWFTNIRKRFWRPYCNELAELGCSLATDVFGRCRCGEEEEDGPARKKQKKKAAAQPPPPPPTMDADLEDGQPPMHYWLHMFD